MKKTIRTIGLAIAVAFVPAITAGAEIPEQPYRIKKLNDRITIFQPGLYGNASCLAVVTTGRGLIVIDTGLTSDFAGRMKQKFRETSGRDDVRYVINTHSHWDHTGGNQAFPEAVIVGHENIVPAMKRFVEDKDRFLARRREYIARLAKDLSGKDRDSRDGRSLSESLEREQAFVKDLESTYVSTPPTMTFSDRLTLRLDDLTVGLYYYSDCFSPGPSQHTDSDVLIRIPELGALFTGDALFFHEKALAPIPSPDDLPRWLSLMGEILAEPVTLVSDGHANPLLGTGEMLTVLHRYMRELYEAAVLAKKEGLDDRTFRDQNALLPRYAYLKKFYDLDSKDIRDQHQANLDKNLRLARK